MEMDLIMKEYKFDLDTLIKTCKKYGIDVGNSSGKITLDGTEKRLSDIIENCMIQAGEKMWSEPKIIINGIDSNNISSHNYYSNSEFPTLAA